MRHAHLVPYTGQCFALYSNYSGAARCDAALPAVLNIIDERNIDEKQELFDKWHSGNGSDWKIR